MPNHRSDIPENRDLTLLEMRLVRWLLNHGVEEALKFLGDLDKLRVVSRCACGCPSINFSDDWSGGMTVLSDYQFDDPSGGLSGVFVFAYGNKLAGLDICSIDGVSNPAELPEPSALRPLS